MKYFKCFEDFGSPALDSINDKSPFSKNYGEKYPLNKIEIGTLIVYKGTPYYVVSNNGKLGLSLEKDGIIKYTIDQTEFDNKCCINR